MEQYTITGMSCAACQTRVEKAVSKVPGVISCSVSLLTNSMGVEGTASSSEIIEAVQAAGYGASVKGVEKADRSGNGTLYDESALEDHETPALKKRLVSSIGFLLVLMYFSMGHMMWNWPLPDFFNGNHVAMGLLQLLLTVIVMVINQKFFISGFKGLLHGSPNMDTLVALGSSASFAWSTYALFMMTDAQVKGNADAVMSYMHEFYFESAAMILTLITVGKMLEARSKGRTTDALKGLMKLAPKIAVIEKDGVETTVPITAASRIPSSQICRKKPARSPVTPPNSCTAMWRYQMKIKTVVITTTPPQIPPKSSSRTAVRKKITSMQTATVFFLASFIKSASIPCFRASGNVAVERPLSALERINPIAVRSTLPSSSSVHAAA